MVLPITEKHIKYRFWKIKELLMGLWEKRGKIKIKGHLKESSGKRKPCGWSQTKDSSKIYD